MEVAVCWRCESRKRSRILTVHMPECGSRDYSLQEAALSHRRDIRLPLLSLYAAVVAVVASAVRRVRMSLRSEVPCYGDDVGKPYMRCSIGVPLKSWDSDGCYASYYFVPAGLEMCWI